MLVIIRSTKQLKTLKMPALLLVPFTLVSCCIASAVETGSSPLVALVSVAITLARPAVWEAPVSSLTTITALTKCTRQAWTLSCVLVTETALRALQTTFTN